MAVLNLFFAMWSAWPFVATSGRPNPASLMLAPEQVRSAHHCASQQGVQHWFYSHSKVLCLRQIAHNNTTLLPGAPPGSMAAVEAEAWRPGISGGIMPVLTPVHPTINS
jgi:hypothetical protein